MNNGHASLNKQAGKILEIWKTKREVKEKEKAKLTEQELLNISDLGWKEDKTALEKTRQSIHYLRSILTLRIIFLEKIDSETTHEVVPCVIDLRGMYVTTIMREA